MIVAIDGPAASGKGTLVANLSEYYNLEALDTGSLYRAVALSMIRSGDELQDNYKALQHSLNFDFRLTQSPDLRTAKIGVAASKIALFPDVRAALFNFQRKFATNPPAGKSGTILDGRDIATIVCPEADYKFFVTAQIEVRAKRRLKELLERNEPAIYASLLEELHARDVRDSTRESAPLEQSKDAFTIDTTHLTAEQAFEKAQNYMASENFNRQRI